MKLNSASLCCSASNFDYLSRSPVLFLFLWNSTKLAGRTQSKPKSSQWKKSYSWHYSPQRRIFLSLKNLPFGPLLVSRPAFNSSLYILPVDIPETQSKQPLRVTSAPVFNVSFYLACLMLWTIPNCFSSNNTV